jgi:tRNA(Ile)-lysidine synthase
LQTLRRLVGDKEDWMFEPKRKGQTLGLAVSGGGDSMGMLHLAAGLGLPLWVVTVDHGLRAEAAVEAAAVGQVCAGLGLRHAVLSWRWDGQGNLQDAARRGRRAVMAEWAAQVGVPVVALAHTQEDVAETCLMRLARGAGVDGLAAMPDRWQESGITWVRPLLAVSRAELRDYLAGLGAAWIEDPSNDNDRFERVRMRKAMVGLRDLGLTAARLSVVAGHLAQARVALDQATGQAAARCLTVQGNALRLDHAALATEAAEVQRRVIVGVIGRVARPGYAPRGAALQTLLTRVQAGQPNTLAGVRFQSTRTGAWFFREYKAVADTVCGVGALWDGQWRITGDLPAGAEIRALGAGITLCTAWRQAGLPRAALLASPSLWASDTLLAAPLAGFGAGYGAIPLFLADHCQQSILSH